MHNQITVVTAIRDRESWRIRTMVESIRKTGANPSFHIVDYGSSKEYAAEYKTLCKELKIKYTHMYAEGYPWNKCRALNFGARQAETVFIATSDVDMIYENNSFQWCLDNYKNKSIFHIGTYWLGKDKNKAKAISAGTGNCGGFCFTSKEAFEEIGGYDERFCYWGFEDLDWPSRLKRKGYKQVWLPSEYKIFHQWHKVSEAGNLRPESVNFNSFSFFTENTFIPVLKSSWGLPLTAKERPILAKIESGNFYTISVPPQTFSNNDISQKLYDASKSNKLVKLELGPRLMKRPFDKIRNFARKLLHPLAALCGLKVFPAINFNMDYLYEIIRLLQGTVLKDYFISPDFEYAYLLF